MRMQFGNVVRMQNASLPPRCLASKANTFPAAYFFPQYVLPSVRTPTFIRNSVYNYGDWEVLPRVWQNSHNFTIGGWRNPYSTDHGTCAWEYHRSANLTANNLPNTPDGCNATQKAVIRGFQKDFSAAVAPALDPSSPHGASIDACATCHCQCHPSVPFIAMHTAPLLPPPPPTTARLPHSLTAIVCRTAWS